MSISIANFTKHLQSSFDHTQKVEDYLGDKDEHLYLQAANKGAQMAYKAVLEKASHLNVLDATSTPNRLLSVPSVLYSAEESPEKLIYDNPQDALYEWVSAQGLSETEIRELDYVIVYRYKRAEFDAAAQDRARVDIKDHIIEYVEDRFGDPTGELDIFDTHMEKSDLDELVRDFVQRLAKITIPNNFEVTGENVLYSQTEINRICL